VKMVESNDKNDWNKTNVRFRPSTTKARSINFRECSIKQFHEANCNNHANSNSRSFGNDKEDKPVAIVLVRPRKMGTTTIQQSIRQYLGELAKANYMHLAKRVHLFSNCWTLKCILEQQWEERCKTHRD
jgi:hypothetical protein